MEECTRYIEKKWCRFCLHLDICIYLALIQLVVQEFTSALNLKFFELEAFIFVDKFESILELIMALLFKELIMTETGELYRYIGLHDHNQSLICSCK